MDKELDYELIKKVRKEMLQSPEFLPGYHIYPRTGLLNDPNGLFFDGERYHIFYQWYPYGSKHGLKHWEYITTKDFINYNVENPLIPTLENETHGCYSGGGMQIANQKTIFYTANKRVENYKRKSSQVVAKVEDGKVQSKKVIIEDTPVQYTEDFRDPNPYIEVDGSIGLLIGARKKDDQAAVVKYKYDKQKNEVSLQGEIQFKNVNLNSTYMWECPNLYIDGKSSIFIGCPQGIMKEKYRYHNIYSTVYMCGEYKENDFLATKMDELDKGFDFYAPQFFTGVKEKIILGWIGTPEMTYPTDRYGWHSMVSMPRKLEYRSGKLYQYPHSSITSLIETKSISKNITELIGDFTQSYIKIENIGNENEIKLCDQKGEMYIKIGYRDNLFYVNRENTILTSQMEKYGNTRTIKMSNVQSVEIFSDHSVVELFINGGQEAMTIRYFMNSEVATIQSKNSIDITTGKIKNISLWKESHYEKNT